MDNLLIFTSLGIGHQYKHKNKINSLLIQINGELEDRCSEHGNPLFYLLLLALTHFLSFLMFI